MGLLDTFGRIGFGLATGGLSEVPGLVDKYVTHGTQHAQEAANAQRQGLDAAMKRLQEFSQQQYQGRMQDLDKTLAFYGPAQRYLQSIYSAPPAGPPPGMGTPTVGRQPSGFGGPAAPPPGFPKNMGGPPMDYRQGPRRGF